MSLLLLLCSFSLLYCNTACTCCVRACALLFFICSLSQRTTIKTQCASFSHFRTGFLIVRWSIRVDFRLSLRYTKTLRICAREETTTSRHCASAHTYILTRTPFCSPREPPRYYLTVLYSRSHLRVALVVT